MMPPSDAQCKISIHTLRMEGDLHAFFPAQSLLDISIHTLRMEGDPDFVISHFAPPKFQSTPSAWRVTPWCRIRTPTMRHFNPHPPHGG